MQKFKDVMVFVLAVVLAFETGVLTVVWSFLTAFANIKESNKPERSRVSYRSYYENKERVLVRTLSFYPRLENRTEVTEKHANLIFEKLPDGDFQKTF